MLLSPFYSDFFDDFFDEEQLPAYNYSNSFPQLNIYENENDYYVISEIPGVEKNDLKISLKGDTLSIEGKRKFENDSVKYYRNERTHAEFKRSISIGDKVDKNKIDAILKNGVLKLVLPKSEDIKPKEIKVS